MPLNTAKVSITGIFGLLFGSAPPDTETSREPSGMLRFAGLNPDTRAIAEHLTRIDRREQVDKVRELYTRMRRSNAKCGVLLLYGDEDDAPDDFAHRLAMLSSENPKGRGLVSHSDDDYEDWPHREDVLSSLDKFDPEDFNEDASGIRKWLANEVETDDHDNQALFDAITKRKKLCIIAFKVSRDDTKKKCIADHVEQMTALAEKTSGEGAGFIFIYWLIADSDQADRVALEQLRASERLLSNEMSQPKIDITEWGEITRDHIADWRNTMGKRLNDANADFDAALAHVVDKLLNERKSIRFGQALTEVVNHLKATQDGG